MKSEYLDRSSRNGDKFKTKNATKPYLGFKFLGSREHCFVPDDLHTLLRVHGQVGGVDARNISIFDLIKFCHIFKKKINTPKMNF
jgi:hypothetical protein